MVECRIVRAVVSGLLGDRSMVECRIVQAVVRDRSMVECRIVRAIVKCCVSERGASLLNDWLGGLLGLFFAIDELNADDDLGDEFKALELTPRVLGDRSMVECRIVHNVAIDS